MASGFFVVGTNSFLGAPPDDNMISWKEIVPNLPKRFFMVSSRYFAFATND